MPHRAEPTESQIARAERSGAILLRRRVPAHPGPLLAVDDAAAVLRAPAEAARRVLVLLAVVQRAEAAPRDVILKKVRKPDLWETASPAERRFLECDVPDEQESRSLVWRVECIWTLMWALRHVEELGWPGEMCSVPRLGKLFHATNGVPNLVGSARLRPKEEILDALDLVVRCHWAIRDAQAGGRSIPADLDWARPGEMLPADECPARHVVQERHRALNWLTRFEDAGWDDVRTPT
jgi:hypothetical protein